jgi:hypothetical protein
MVTGPKAPDPYAVANAQGNENLRSAWSSAIIGNANEINPYGQVNYSTVGYEPVTIDGKTQMIPRQQRTITLAPEQQKLLELQNQMQTNLGNLGVSQSSRLQGLLGTNLNTEGITPWQTYAKPGEVRQDQGRTDRAGIEQAMMQSYARQHAPQQSAEDTALAMRGLAPGSQGYGTVQQGREDAFSEAARNAYLASGGEARAAQGAYNAAEAQRFNEQQTWANAMNQLRGGQLQEKAFLRNAPINEIAALMSGSQVSLPQFQPYASPQVAAAPIGQYIYGSNDIAQANASAKMQGLFGLGGAAIGLLGAPMTGGGSLIGSMFA